MGENKKMQWNILLDTIRKREKSTVDSTYNDSRSAFKKDFDTVCNCTGLRRLQDKAQVFPLEKGDYARTRLTHSIEVMSIAESLGVSAVEVILKKEQGKFKGKDLKLIHDIPVILRTAALLHDMGNPPFGHLGEDVIGKWFDDNLKNIAFNGDVFSDKTEVEYNPTADDDRKFSQILSEGHQEDLKNFEGNAQLLRLVSKLSFVTDENGMNLTYPILATIIKYPCNSLEHKKHKDDEQLCYKKTGYFDSEQDLFNDIQEKLHLNKCRHPLTFLLEAADDIAYLTADIEDAQKKGIISFAKIESQLNGRRENKKGFNPQIRENEFLKDIRTEIEKYKKDVQALQYPDRDNYLMQRLRIYLKGQLISKVKESFNNHYEAIMYGTYNKQLLEDGDLKVVCDMIRHIEKEYLYYCDEIVSLKIESYKILSTLLENFILCAFNAEKHKNEDSRDNLIYKLFSKNYCYCCHSSFNELESKRTGNSDKDKIAVDEYVYNRLILVTDVISGMTDSYALSIYKILTATTNII